MTTMILCVDCNEKMERKSTTHKRCRDCAKSWERLSAQARQKRQNKIYYERHSEQEKERKRQHRIRDNKQANSYSDNWVKRHPDEKFGQHLKREYGITVEEYKRKFQDQKGVCALCGKPETVMINGRVRRLAVDHNFESGQVRGLLCTVCNRNRVGVYEKAMKDTAVRDYLRKYE